MNRSEVSRRSFVRAFAAAASSALLPRGLRGGMPTSAGAVPETRETWPPVVRPFPLGRVVLGEGPFKVAREADRRYLHSLPPDRLLHTFRLNAGLGSSAQALGGWEAPDCELRGHFAGGHYLSACALMVAATGDPDLRANADTVVAELARCQGALKGGYLSAFPVEFFDRLRNREKVWAPFYTLHKILAGLIDMHVHAGNAQALEVAEKLAVWVGGYVTPLSFDHMQRILGTEFGGIAESLYDLYAITGKEAYLGTAGRFAKQAFLDPLAAHRDELKGLHANTHIPQVIAAARCAELTGDPRSRAIAEYFWDEVVKERCYCTGGTSNGEKWNTDPGHLASELGTSTTECCCAYNMMRLTRRLFSWAPRAELMDYYERTLFNHRLGTINPEDGALMYYLPLASGYWKTFGKPFDSLWCCTGTGCEEYAKLTDTVYFQEKDSLYVNLFMDSELDWSEKGLRIKQATRFPEEQGTTLRITAATPVAAAINIRIPSWAQGGRVEINGKPLPTFASPGSYLVVDRTWRTGDSVAVRLPMGLHVEPMPDDETVQAVLYGPLVLAGRFERVGEDRSYGDYEPKLGEARKVPEIRGGHSWVEPDPRQPLLFRSVGQEQALSLVPLNTIIHETYAVYWKVNPATPL
jgi:DUF1680 family protein